jgi:hypothetical protein
MGITGSGFITKAAIKYSPIAGQIPEIRKNIIAMALAQKIEKSK